MALSVTLRFIPRPTGCESTKRVDSAAACTRVEASMVMGTEGISDRSTTISPIEKGIAGV